jgi:hypothetical protein
VSGSGALVDAMAVVAVTVVAALVVVAVVVVGAVAAVVFVGTDRSHCAVVVTVVSAVT